MRGGDQLTAADLKNTKTHEANHNARPVEEILREFRRRGSALVERVAGFEVTVIARTMLHPRMKTPMRLVDHFISWRNMMIIIWRECWS